jgi:hypothetical protein
VPATRSIALDKLPENTEERHEDRIVCNKENGLKYFLYIKKKKTELGYQVLSSR